MRRAGQAAGAAPHHAVFGGSRLLAQEPGEVARDGRVGRIGQPQFLQTHAALRGGHLGAAHCGQKAFAQHLLDIRPQQRSLDGAAHQSRAFTENRDRLLLGFRIRFQELFLGQAAVRPQCLVLPAIDARAFFSQTMRHHSGQGQVHVVAAQQDMFAHGHAVERQFAVRFGYRDEGEVGGAAADIHNQNQVAHLHPLAPVVVPLNPGVECGLRLLQQSDVFIARLPGGVQGELTRHRVERCRNRHQHLLRGERGIRHF